MPAEYLDELIQKITTKADLKGFDELDKKQKRATKQNDALSASFKRIFGFIASGMAIRSVIENSRKIDLLQKSLNGLTGSVEAGAEQFQYLRQEAYRTGSDLLKIGGAYKNFYSAARGAGFKESETQTMFSQILTGGRAIGISQEQMGGALLALEQMLSKGKVSMEELRRQLGNALPGAMQIAARAMGVTNEKFQEMLKSGIKSSEFVPKFAAQVEKELGKGMPEAIKSLDFALVNLSTAWTEFQAAILQGEGGQALAEFVKELTTLLRDKSTLDMLKLIGKALALIIKNLRWILFFWSVGKIHALVSSIGLLRNAIFTMGLALGATTAQATLLNRGFLLLFGGRTLAGVKAITVGFWAMARPLLAISTLLAGLISWILILQDVWLTFSDKTADTFLRRFLDHLETMQNLKINPFGGGGQGFSTPQDKPTYFTPTSAAPTYMSTPRTGGNYAQTNASNLSNSLTINNYFAPNSDPKAIGESVKTTLLDVFTNYQTGYA